MPPLSGRSRLLIGHRQRRSQAYRSFRGKAKTLPECNFRLLHTDRGRLLVARGSSPKVFVSESLCRSQLDYLRLNNRHSVGDGRAVLTPRGAMTSPTSPYKLCVRRRPWAIKLSTLNKRIHLLVVFQSRLQYTVRIKYTSAPLNSISKIRRPFDDPCSPLGLPVGNAEIYALNNHNEHEKQITRDRAPDSRPVLWLI